MPKKKNNSEGGDDIKGGGCPFIPAKFFNLGDEQIGINGKRYKVAKRGEGEDESYFWSKLGERELKMRMLFIRDGKMSMPALARPTRNLHLLTGKLADYAKELPLDSGERFQPPPSKQAFSFNLAAEKTTPLTFGEAPSPAGQTFSFGQTQAPATLSFGQTTPVLTQAPATAPAFSFGQTAAPTLSFSAPVSAPTLSFSAPNPFGSSTTLSTDFQPGLFGQNTQSQSLFGQSTQPFGQSTQPFGQSFTLGQPQAIPIIPPGGYYPGFREYPDTSMG